MPPGGVTKLHFGAFGGQRRGDGLQESVGHLDDRVTAELASKLDSSALAPAIAPLATAAPWPPRTGRWPRTEAASPRCRAR